MAAQIIEAAIFNLTKYNSTKWLVKSSINQYIVIHE
jgi:hypothetical protein